MKQTAINLFIKCCVKITNKSQVELAQKWGVHYFLTRSRIKAYWLTIFS